MKLKFFYDEFGVPDVEGGDYCSPVIWFLTDNDYVHACDEILQKLSEIRESGGAWEMGYNKTSLKIESDVATCSKSYEDKKEIKIPSHDFEKILLAWRNFLEMENKELVVEFGSIVSG